MREGGRERKFSARGRTGRSFWEGLRRRYTSKGEAVSDAFADAGRLRQELDSVWKMHDLLKRENADLRAKLEEARKDAVPVADILASAAHVAENGAAVARFGGQYEHEGRCRELCAMYLRELVGAFRLKQQFAAIDAAIAQGKGEK